MSFNLIMPSLAIFRRCFGFFLAGAKWLSIPLQQGRKLRTYPLGIPIFSIIDVMYNQKSGFMRLHHFILNTSISIPSLVSILFSIYWS